MKKLLSNRPGRLIPLLVLMGFVFCLPAYGDVLVGGPEIRIGGGGGTGSGEGDPLDTNDYGGGGGDGSDIHDDAGLNSGDSVPEIRVPGIRIFMVPEFLNGKIVFRVLFIFVQVSEVQDIGLEGYHAP